MKGCVVSKCYLDASFFVALQVVGHVHREKAEEKLDKLSQNQTTICYSWLMIDEAIHVLHSYYDFSKEKVAFAVKESLIEATNSQLVTNLVQEEKLLKYLRFWQKNKLRPRDALHLFLIKQHKIKTIATFDQDFIAQRKKLKIEIL